MRPLLSTVALALVACGADAPDGDTAVASRTTTPASGTPATGTPSTTTSGTTTTSTTTTAPSPDWDPMTLADTWLSNTMSAYFDTCGPGAEVVEFSVSGVTPTGFTLTSGALGEPVDCVVVQGGTPTTPAPASADWTCAAASQDQVAGSDTLTWTKTLSGLAPTGDTVAIVLITEGTCQGPTCQYTLPFDPCILETAGEARRVVESPPTGP